VLVAEDLHKSYGGRKALLGLSFSLHAGHILGFLGPNGAGKTTAIRILTTILEPSSGRFTVDGISSEHPEQIRRKIGVLPESLGFPKQMTGLEYLTYFGQHYGKTAVSAKATALSLMDEVGLQKRGRSLIGSYSRGMRQRLGIARALVNDPVVVFLDEPTLGLDPAGQRELQELIRRIAHERNAGVVLCSHLLTEVEEVCDDVVILKSGQVVASGTAAEVIGKAERNLVRLHVPARLLPETKEMLETVPNVVQVTPSKRRHEWLEVELMDLVQQEANEAYHVQSGRILEMLLQAGIPVLSFEAEGGRLQDVFLELTEGETDA
jgi:ABC-2 type transport system ATP-binding protein